MQGMTLLELLISIAVLAIFFSVSTLAFQHIAADHAIHNDANKIQSLIYEAQSRAMTQKLHPEISINDSNIKIYYKKDDMERISPDYGIESWNYDKLSVSTRGVIQHQKRALKEKKAPKNNLRQ